MSIERDVNTFVNGARNLFSCSKCKELYRQDVEWKNNKDYLKSNTLCPSCSSRRLVIIEGVTK